MGCSWCSNVNPENNKNFEIQKIDENQISMDYFFNLIPTEIDNEMKKEKFQNYNNNAILKTIRIINNDNSFEDFKDNIKDILYHGEFNESGLKEGIGKMIIIKENEKQFYHGIWENDDLIKGKIYYEDGSTYSGDIKNYKRDGNGKFKSEKEEYDGEWKKDQKNGEGTLIFSDKTKYKGHFKDNKFDGRGTMNWKNGFSYEGYFMNNFLHGKGYLRGSNNHIYDGYFQNGKFHGEGTFKWINRESATEYYKGNYSSGQKDGKGEFHFGNGHIYYGWWKSGDPDGEGIYETQSRKYYGNWRSGIFMQLIEVEEKEQVQEENLNLTFKVPAEDIFITDHISTSINTSTSIKSSDVNPMVTYLK